MRQLVGEADPEATPRLVTYVNAVQQHARLFDGFLLRRRPRLAAPLAVTPQPLVAVPDPTPLRRAEGAPLHVCLGGGAIAAEPRRIPQPRLEPRTGPEVARARALMAEMGCSVDRRRALISVSGSDHGLALRCRLSRHLLGSFGARSFRRTRMTTVPRPPAPARRARGRRARCSRC